MDGESGQEILLHPETREKKKSLTKRRVEESFLFIFAALTQCRFETNHGPVSDHELFFYCRSSTPKSEAVGYIKKVS